MPPYWIGMVKLLTFGKMLNVLVFTSQRIGVAPVRDLLPYWLIFIRYVVLDVVLIDLDYFTSFRNDCFSQSLT